MLVELMWQAWRLEFGGTLKIRSISQWRKWNLLSGLPGGSDGKSAYNVGDLGSIPGLSRSPGGGHGNSLWYSCLENPHGQKSLEGYSPWSHKELDTMEWLNTAPIKTWSVEQQLQYPWETVRKARLHASAQIYWIRIVIWIESPWDLYTY